MAAPIHYLLELARHDGATVYSVTRYDARGMMARDRKGVKMLNGAKTLMGPVGRVTAISGLNGYEAVMRHGGHSYKRWVKPHDRLPIMTARPRRR